LNGELISRSKCKRQAAQQTNSTWQTQFSLNQTTEFSEDQTNNQTLFQTNKHLLSQSEENFNNWNQIHSSIVFLPGPEILDTFSSSAELITSALQEPVITDTGQFDLSTLIDESFFVTNQTNPSAVSAQPELLGEAHKLITGESLFPTKYTKWNHFV
jgi:hypothetical protein